MKNLICLAAAALCLLGTASHAQQPRQQDPRQATPAMKEDALDPTPVNPANDPDTDLFVGDYRNAKPRPMYGQLSVRDILTRLDSSDPIRPKTKGAVLTLITAVSYATLAPGQTAGGRARAGERQIFYTTAGSGTILSAGKRYDLKDGVGFVLTPDFDFTITSTGKSPLAFYVRTEPVPANAPPSAQLVVTNRFDGDRRVGSHWVHICNGGPAGMTLCTVAPHTMPQPHSHPGEEVWILVKGESILMLGKDMRKMIPGQAYKIPPTGLAAHSNLNLTDEPIQLLYMGPAVRGQGPGGAPTGTRQQDYAQLDNSPINVATDQDVDMFVGDWKSAYPRIVHGNLYFRDMLTALDGPDALHPTRKGAVLTGALAVSYAMLEPGAVAHTLGGEMKNTQETYIVNSGTGSIAANGKTIQLAKDMAFTLTPGLDFKLMASGDKYMTFFVVTGKLSEGFSPTSSFQVIDKRANPQNMTDWHNQERELVSRADGLGQYSAVSQIELKPMAMSRPKSAAKDSEEIWIATEGNVELLFGKKLIELPAGTAYRVPSNGITAHANINVSRSPARFLRVK